MPPSALRLVKRILSPLNRRHYVPMARLYRGLLGGVRFVGITGSCGKTSTKEMAAAVLGAKGEGVKGIQIFNRSADVARTILSVRPWHSFCVDEIGASDPGLIVLSSSIFRPHVSAVTMIGLDHYKAYRSTEAIAAEKAGLVKALPDDGTAVLNVDDPLVWAMRESTRARVIGYGLSEEAALRAEDVSSVWPERLSFTAVYEGERHRVQTQLLGEAPLHSVLAALAIGLASDIPLPEAIRRIEAVEPVFCRMSPHTTPDGVTFINDVWKAPYYALPETLDFMRKARAERKLFVFGTFSDYPGSASNKYRRIAREALEIADKVIFNCPLNKSVLKERSHPEDDRLMVFDTAYEVSRYLGEELRSGDLVMLKASSANHHERLIMDRMALGGALLDRDVPAVGVSCWRERCGLFKPCMFCEKRGDEVVPLLS